MNLVIRSLIFLAILICSTSCSSLKRSILNVDGDNVFLKQRRKVRTFALTSIIKSDIPLGDTLFFIESYDPVSAPTIIYCAYLNPSSMDSKVLSTYLKKTKKSRTKFHSLSNTHFSCYFDKIPVMLYSNLSSDINIPRHCLVDDGNVNFFTRLIKVSRQKYRVKTVRFSDFDCSDDDCFSSN